MNTISYCHHQSFIIKILFLLFLVLLNIAVRADDSVPVVSPAVAVTLNPGDIIVADAGSRKLIRIDPTTGAQTIIAQGALFEPVFNPRGLTSDTEGNILISDMFFGEQSRILKVDASTGTQTILSSGGLLQHLYGIAIDSSGNVLVSDLSSRGLIQVNPFNGSQTAFSLGGFFENPRPIAIRPNGDIFVANEGGITGISSIIRVDPLTRAQTKVSSGGLLTNPEGMVIDTNGNIFVANIGSLGAGAIIRVNPVTGDQTQIASRFSPGSFIELPISLAVDSNNNILIADEAGRVVRLNPEVGDQTIVAEGGNLNTPFAIAVIPVTAGDANHPPAVDAGPNIKITSEQQSTTVLNGTATDQDSDPLTYRWLEGQTQLLGSTSVGPNGEAPLNLSTVPLTVGAHTLTLEVSDGKTKATDEIILTIDNSAPHPAPTGGGTYQINAPVTVGGQISDFDGDQVTYAWSEGAMQYCRGPVQTTQGGTPVPLPDCALPVLGLGLHTVVLTVSDGINQPVASDILIKVEDTTVPTLAPVPSQSILWPPNHKMVNITIVTHASDNSGPPTLSAVVISNEPQNGLGDGDTAPDCTTPVINQTAGVIKLQLRAERSGSGDGRKYSIIITATDPSQNASSATVIIIVPHDQGKN